MPAVSITAGIIKRVRIMAKKQKQNTRAVQFIKDLKRDKLLVFLTILPVLYFIIFQYLPMGGLVMAFQKYSPGKGIFKSDFVGFKWFITFFQSNNFYRVVKNTLLLSFGEIIFGFPLPIIFALMLNEIRSKTFKKITQTISYFPHFISTVVICGLIWDLFSADQGMINQIRGLFGLEKVAFLSTSSWFRPIYIGSSIWQHCGWGSIVYLAALAGIDQEMYEAARVDGATRWKRMIYITIPSLLPTIMTLLILRMGQVMSVGFEKVLLLYSPSIYNTADIISTFVYRRGILDSQYSFGVAVGLFNSVVNFMLVISANKLSKKFTETGIW